MENEALLKLAIVEASKKLGLEVTPSDVAIEASRGVGHGDYSSNFAMRFSKSLSKKGPEFANELKDLIESPIIDHIEVLGLSLIHI